MSDYPRDFSSYGSIDHLARLLVRSLCGEWCYCVGSEPAQWYRRINRQWVAALPHEVHARCTEVIESVIRDAERIPNELRHEPRLVDRVIDLATFDLRIMTGSDRPPNDDGPAE